MIESENILNKNIIMETYKYCLKHKVLMVANLAPVYFIIRSIYMIADIIIDGYFKIIAVTGLTLFHKIFIRIFIKLKDNQKAEEIL